MIDLKRDMIERLAIVSGNDDIFYDTYLKMIDIFLEDFRSGKIKNRHQALIKFDNYICGMKRSSCN